MSHKEFFNWLADRLVNVYGESPNVDFVHKLRDIAKNIDQDETKLLEVAEQQNTSCVS